MSHRFRDTRQYPLKIANFSHPRVLNAPDEGVPQTDTLQQLIRSMLRVGRKKLKTII